MTIRTQIVTLQIDFDDEKYDPPAEWDWPQLIDAEDPKDVKVTYASGVTE